MEYGASEKKKRRAIEELERWMIKEIGLSIETASRFKVSSLPTNDKTELIRFILMAAVGCLAIWPKSQTSF